MPTFRCKIVTQRGRVTERTVQAKNRSVLKDVLEGEGNFILNIQRVEGIGAFIKRGRAQRRIKIRDFLVFNQEFSVLIKAGLPIVAALDTLIEKEKTDELSETLTDIRNDISGGASLSEAFGKHSHLFSNLYVASLQAGEKSGNLTVAITRYIRYVKKMAEIRQKIITASVYPVILTVVSIFTVLFLLIYVVPSFTRTYFEAGTELPTLTLFLLSVSQGVKNHFHYILLLIVFGVIGYFLVRRSEAGRRYFDKTKLKIPFIGSIYLHYSISKMARTLATVLGGGITLLESIRISSGTMDNDFLKEKWEESSDDMEKGSGFAESLSKTAALPRMAIKMVEAGESSGALEQVLDDIADFYESDVDTKLSILTSSIEPALMIIMGLLIGFIVLAMYMPIFQMASTLG